MGQAQALLSMLGYLWPMEIQASEAGAGLALVEPQSGDEPQTADDAAPRAYASADRLAATGEPGGDGGGAGSAAPEREQGNAAGQRALGEADGDAAGADAHAARPRPAEEGAAEEGGIIVDVFSSPFLLQPKQRRPRGATHGSQRVSAAPRPQGGGSGAMGMTDCL